MCGGCGGGVSEGVPSIFFLLLQTRHQQLLFSLKICRVYPGALHVLRHFII